MGVLRELIGRQVRQYGNTHRRQGARQALVREYNCQTRTQAKVLIDELLELQDKTYHRACVTIDGCKVTLKTWTPNQGITELDEEFTAEADIIFEDVSHRL